jgi:hypothetical protein
MTNTSLGLEIFVRFYYKICSTKPRIATTSGFLYIKKKSCGKYSQWKKSPMFFLNYTAIIVYSLLHVSDPLLSPCYSTIAEGRPVDRTLHIFLQLPCFLFPSTPINSPSAVNPLSSTNVGSDGLS